MLEYMYPQAVEAGIPATEYWGMTLEEIMVQVQANKQIKENEMRERAYFDYAQQKLSIYAFNDPKNFPGIEDVYPYLKEVKRAVEETKSEEELKQEAMKREQEIFIAQAEAIKATRARRKKQNT